MRHIVLGICLFFSDILDLLIGEKILAAARQNLPVKSMIPTIDSLASWLYLAK